MSTANEQVVVEFFKAFDRLDLYAEHTKRWLISWRVHKGGLLPSHNQTSLRS